MTTQQLRALIQHSALLSEPERKYWLGNLSRMNDKQLAKLWEILDVPDQMPFEDAVTDYFTSLSLAAKAA